MALFQCPECRDAVSDRARVCPHCGCPITDADGDCGKYAVVAMGAGPIMGETAECLSRLAALSRDEARAALASTPAVLFRGLTRKEAGDKAAALGDFCVVKVVPDGLADSADQAADADAVLTPARRRQDAPLGFGAIVGAVLLALCLWGIVVSLLFP